MTDSICILSARELNRRFVEGELTACQITDAFLERIDRLDGKVKAFLAVYHKRARQQAKELDRKKANNEKLGPLAAIPIAIKDNMHVEGEITTCGSKFLTNYRAPFAATAVRLLEEADAIIIGKTNCDEFAMGSSNENSAFGPVHNPWALDCVPGGSSGGSAAAVAARFCPLSLGSDTGGSIRQPAALCGIVGLKPTYGRVSRYGLVAFGSSLDQIGPFAHNVEDVALIMETIGHHCAWDSTSLDTPPGKFQKALDGNLEGLRVGVPHSFLDDLEGEPRKYFEENLDKFRELGATVVDVDLDILRYSIATYYIIATAEASTNLARFDGVRYGVRSEKAKTLDEVYDLSRQEGFGPEVKRRIILGTFVLSSGYQDAYYKQAQRVRTIMIQKFATAFKNCDIIAMPSSPSTAFKIGAKQDPLQLYLEDLYTIGANCAGVPAISVPAGIASDGKPLGFQLVGPQQGDVEVVRIAAALASATGHTQLMPQLEG